MSSAVAPEPSRTALPGAPYKGLTPYGEEDAALFFGRDVWSDIVTDNIKAYRLTLLYGESGVGKSSVLRAGVAHRLRAQAARNLEADGSPGLAVVVFSSWRGDVEAALVDALDAAGAESEAANGHGRATEATFDAAVERCAARCGGRIHLVLDQFEEYFVYHPTGLEQGGFDAALPRVLARRDLPLNVLIAIREDAVARLDRFKSGIPNLFDNYLRLDHLDRAAARDAIERPLERVSSAGEAASIEPELVEAVLDEVQAGTLEVAQGGAVRVGGAAHEVETPYLQLVMTRLWAEEQRAGSHVLQLSTLAALGGAQGIVSTHLGDAMASLPPEQRDVAARAFRYLVTRSRSKIAHSVTDLADWTDVEPDQMAGVLERLSSGDARILRPVGEGSYEIYHDVLADAILAWRAAHEASRRVEEEKRRSELATRRRVARLGLAVGVLAFAVVVLLLVLAIKASNTADRQRAIAKEQGQIAFSRELASNSLQQGRQDADLGIRLALAAWNASHTDEARAALRAVLERAPVRPPVRLHTAGGPNSVVDAEYAGNGDRILTFSFDKAELWDADSQRRIAAFPIALGPPVPAAAPPAAAPPGSAAPAPPVAVALPPTEPAVSGDGSRIVTAARGGAKVWSATQGSLVRRLRMSGTSPASLAMDQRGTLVAAPMARRGIGVWSVRTGRRIHLLGGREHFDGAQFSGRGRRVIGSGSGRTRRLVVFRVSDGRTLVRSIEPASVSPDGRWAVLPANRKHAPRLVDLATGALERVTIPLSASVTFASRGPYLIVQTRSTVMLWNAAKPRLIRRQRFGDRVQSASPTADGTKALVLLNNGEMRLWETRSGRSAPVARASVRTINSIESAALSPDGRQALTTGYPSGAAVWDLRGVGATVRVLSGQGRTLTDMAVDDRGQLLATGDWRGTVRFWDPARGDELGHVRAGGGQVAHIAFDRDGRRLVTGDADGTATVWDVANRQPLASVRRRHLTAVAIAPDGRQLAIGDRRGVVLVRPVDRGGRQTSIRVSRRPLLSLQFSADGARLLTASGRNAAIWDPSDGRLLARLQRHVKSSSACCTVPYPGAVFSPDEHRIAMVGADGALRIWDDRGKRLLELRAGRDKMINHAVFSPDGSLVAAGADDASVRLIDSRTGVERGRLRAPTDAEIARVGFSPDGSRVVGMSADGVTRIWDVASHEQLAVIQGREPFDFYRAEFSPDGTQIIKSDGDDSVLIRPCVVCLTPREMISLAKARARRQLTAAERRKWLHEKG